MASKEKECCACSDELYGGDPCALEHAFKQQENIRKHVEKVLAPAIKDAEELADKTATEKVRLQGTKETKVPSLKPYTESKEVKNREELAKLIKEANDKNLKWKVKRSITEGYRYTFEVLKEEPLVEEIIETDNGVVLDVSSPTEDDRIEMEEPSDDIEVELDTTEVEKELTPCDIWKNHLDITIDKEGHSASMCVKGCEDKDCCIIVPDLTDEELEVLCDAFGCEETKEEIVEESLTEDEHKEETTIEADKVETTKCEYGECKEKTEIFTELPDFDVEVEQKGDKVEIEIEPKEKEEIIIEPEEIEEASTAEKRAFKHGGKDYIDLLRGRAIARIKDPKARKAAIDLVKSGDIDIADDRIIGDRKTSQADVNISKKMQQMSDAGVKDYSDKELVEKHEEDHEENKVCPKCGKELKPGEEPCDDCKKEHKLTEQQVFTLNEFYFNESLSSDDLKSEWVILEEDDKFKLRKDGKDIDELSPEFTSNLLACGCCCDDECSDEGKHEEDKLEEEVTIHTHGLHHFKPIAGAKDTWDLIVANDKVEDLDKALEDMYPEGIDDTDLNDLLWFEKDWVLDTLGINPFIKSGDDVIDAEVIETEEEK